MDQWQYIFGIGALVYIVPGIIFIMFGSGDVQSWNKEKDTKTPAQVESS